MIYFKTEKDMEDLFMKNKEWFKSFFKINDSLLRRQVNIEPYGVCDIVAIQAIKDPEGSVVVVVVDIFELKNEPLTAANVSQLARYRTFFEELDEFYEYSIEVRCTLIGPKTLPAANDLCFLLQSIDWLSVYEFDLNPSSGVDLTIVKGWRRNGGVSEDHAVKFLSALPAMDSKGPVK